MKLLLVDDAPPAREPLELQLRILGHEVFSADDGQDALDIFCGNRFDLIITDIRMPRLNGLELLQQIRGMRPDQDVIMVTGHGDMDSSLDALRHGACNYLMKPVSLEELTLAVRTVEQRQALTRRLKEQEFRLEQARKMADLGVVAAGVAHEINNPTTFIRGNVQMLQRFWDVLMPYLDRSVEAGVRPPDKLSFIMEEVPRLLDAMLSGTDRIREIVENTAAFTRPRDEESRVAVDLNECVRMALDGMFPATSTIELVSDLKPGLPPVRGTEDGVVEIVSELVRNGARAVDARSDPRLEIRTIAPSPGAVMLTVEDNGMGINEEVRPKIFTPFFTTDPRIGRPGLGLSKVYALVRGFGGETFFTSRVGEGSCFNVKLPVSDEEAVL